MELATKLLSQNAFWLLDHIPNDTTDAVKVLVTWMKLYKPDPAKKPEDKVSLKYVSQVFISGPRVHRERPLQPPDIHEEVPRIPRTVPVEKVALGAVHSVLRPGHPRPREGCSLEATHVLPPLRHVWHCAHNVRRGGD